MKRTSDLCACCTGFAHTEDEALCDNSSFWIDAKDEE